MFEMFAVRHGQSMANSQSIIQGQTSTPLSPFGMQQAEALAKHLANIRFDAVYSSDLERATQTAAYAAPYREAILCKELREWNLGIFQGVSTTKVAELYPNEWHCFLQSASDYRIPGGETGDEVHARAISFLKRLEGEFTGERVLVVSHGGTIRSMLKYVLGIEGPWHTRPQVTNAGVSRFVFKDGTWQLGTWNDVSHLDGLMPTTGNF